MRLTTCEYRRKRHTNRELAFHFRRKTSIFLLPAPCSHSTSFPCTARAKSKGIIIQHQEGKKQERIIVLCAKTYQAVHADEEVDGDLRQQADCMEEVVCGDLCGFVEVMVGIVAHEDPSEKEGHDS